MAVNKEKTAGINTAGLTGFLVATLLLILYFLAPWQIPASIHILVLLAPLWMPIIGSLVFYRLWLRYRRANYLKTLSSTVLEVLIPRELRKTPLAMEAVFTGLYLTFGETTFIDRNFLGKVRTWFSFELVSTEGQMHFYIWTRSFFADLLKSHIYAHYPEVEIREVEDYTKFIPFDLKRYEYYGCDFRFNAADVYPLKTYIDYGLEKAGDEEEEKVDPLASLIEFLGSVTKGNHLWLQIIIRAHRGHRKWPWTKRNSLKEQTEEEIEHIIQEAAERTRRVVGKARGVEDEEMGMSGVNLSEGDREKIKVLDRSANKLAYDAGIRGLYIAEKGKANSLFLVGMLAGWRHFSANNFNSLAYTRYLAGFDYPWQDFRDIMRNRERRRIYEAYRRRSYFYEPFKTRPIVLNTEELATLYHFPGEVVKTPTAPRIPSRRGEAPSNLPV